MGRGGSDLSSAVVAVSLGSKHLENWTDVDGFMTADPHIVPEARVIEEIGFVEASELCFFGAKILHPKTIRPIIDAGGEVYIRNTFNFDNPGTKIAKKIKNDCHSVV